MITGCSDSNINSSSVQDNNNQYQINSVTNKFAKAVESEEIIIDENYYKHFPDSNLSSSIDQLSSGIIPENITLATPSQYQSQSFFSFLNHKATIEMYENYGTPEKFFVTGRVFEKKSITPDSVGDSKFTNFIRTIKFLTPDPISNVDVNVSVNGVAKTGKTDRKGFFKVEFDNTNFKLGVNDVLAKLSGTKYKYDVAQDSVIIDDAKTEKIGVISDFDDTAKYTGVGHLIKMIKGILIGNYKTDKQVEGVSDLYNGILNGQQSVGNSVFYVTGGPVLLYQRVKNFLRENHFPNGSIDMKKSGSTVDPNPSDTLNYKISKIRLIIKAFPNKKFICFGDTTQVDSQVYLTVKKEFPNNIIGIYINNVNQAESSDPKYQGVILTKSAIESAQDLLQKGIIDQATVDKVTADVK